MNPYFAITPDTTDTARRLVSQADYSRLVAAYPHVADLDRQINGAALDLADPLHMESHNLRQQVLWDTQWAMQRALIQILVRERFPNLDETIARYNEAWE